LSSLRAGALNGSGWSLKKGYRSPKERVEGRDAQDVEDGGAGARAVEGAEGLEARVVRDGGAVGARGRC